MNFYVCFLLSNQTIMYLREFDTTTGTPQWTEKKEQAKGYYIYVARTAMQNCKRNDTFLMTDPLP